MTNALVFLIVLLFVYIITLKKEKSKSKLKLDSIIACYLKGKKDVRLLEARVDGHTDKIVKLITSLNNSTKKNTEINEYTEQLELDYLILSSNLVDLTHDVD